MIAVEDGVVRLDDAGVAALLGGRDAGASAAHDLERAGLGPALETLKGPVVTLEVLVAGASLQLHRGAVDPERAVVLLAVRPDLHQLMVLPPSHVAAALVRMTRVGPRRTSARDRRPAPAEASVRMLSADAGVRQRALREAGVALAWRLRVGWDGEHRDRVFATALPPGSLEPRD